MPKLGSKQNPLILRVSDESKIGAIAEICNENGWQFMLGIEPDKEEDLSDLERKLYPPTPYVAKKAGINEPCECGSGKKFKKCCMMIA